MLQLQKLLLISLYAEYFAMKLLRQNNTLQWLYLFKKKVLQNLNIIWRQFFQR